MKHYLTVKDHSVSGENFNLLYDAEFDLLKTDPQPSPDEIGRYYDSEDYISHTDGKRGWFEKIYHIVKVRALKRKLSLINKQHPEKGNLLDYGCGTGDFLVCAKKGGWNISGYEPSEKAKAFAEKKGISVSPDLHSFADATFDVITLWHVLEHVHDVPAQLKEFKRLLKPHGTLIVAVPNFKSDDAKHYGQFWAAFDVPRHLWHFSKNSIAKLARNVGMALQSVKPMLFDAFYVSLLSEKYKSGKMNPVKAFFVGVKSNWKGWKTSEFSSHIYIIKNR